MAVKLSKEAFEFYTYKAKDEIEFKNLEGGWNYIYFGYKRIGDKDCKGLCVIWGRWRNLRSCI